MLHNILNLGSVFHSFKIVYHKYSGFETIQIQNAQEMFLENIV